MLCFFYVGTLTAPAELLKFEPLHMSHEHMCPLPVLLPACLQGEFVTGIGRGSKPSINVDLRKQLGLFANVVHSFNMPGIESR